MKSFGATPVDAGLIDGLCGSHHLRLVLRPPITGRFTPTTGRASVLQPLKGNSFSRHARSFWHDSRFAYKRRVEILPVMEYLFRHDDRRLRARRKRRSWDQKSSAKFGDETRFVVLQDIGLPIEAIGEYIRNFHEARGVWPIWMYPLRPPVSFGRCSFGTGAPFEHMFWNIRFYSSSAAYDGAMERRLRNLHGFRYLHCRAPCSEETVWVFHDDRWYGELRSRWSAQSIPNVGTRLSTSRPLTCSANTLSDSCVVISAL